MTKKQKQGARRSPAASNGRLCKRECPSFSSLHFCLSPAVSSPLLYIHFFFFSAPGSHVGFVLLAFLFFYALLAFRAPSFFDIARFFLVAFSLSARLIPAWRKAKLCAAAAFLPPFFLFFFLYLLCAVFGSVLFVRRGP